MSIFPAIQYVNKSPKKEHFEHKKGGAKMRVTYIGIILQLITPVEMFYLRM